MSEITPKELECLTGLDNQSAPFPKLNLTLEEYCEFVWANLQNVSLELLERQRQLEAPIHVAFQIR